jgi:hypothetical protein
MLRAAIVRLLVPVNLMLQRTSPAPGARLNHHEDTDGVLQ